MCTTSMTLLLRLCERNDPQDWQRFTHIYTPLILARARSLGLQRADADDLAQDVLFRLLQSLPSYQRQGPGSFRRWLNTIVRNRFGDFLRVRRPRELEAGTEPADPDWEARIEIEEREHRATVVRRTLELIRGDFTPATWAAFTAFVVEGRPAAAVAGELGISENAVHLARSRVLRRLRAEIGDAID